MPQVQIPNSIRFIVFDEFELIIFVSQGLTLSTASLVLIWRGKRSFISIRVTIVTEVILDTF